MWLRTLLAMLVGCVLSASLVLNINYILPSEVDDRLLTGLLAAFPIWIIICLYCYACENRRRNWLALSGVLVTSSLFNGLFFLS